MEKRLEKRLDEISNYLLSHGKASVKELSDCFGVTMETIRKDLEFLQRKGILFRTHGGAVLRNSFTDVPIDVRTQEKIEIKKAICMEVINFIHDDDVVFVDPSSTALPLGKLFSFRKNLLIITNCFEMMNELKESRNEVVFLGGKYSRSGNRTEGQFVSDMASRFSYDAAIFGTLRQVPRKRCGSVPRVSDPYFARGRSPKSGYRWPRASLLKFEILSHLADDL